MKAPFFAVCLLALIQLASCRPNKDLLLEPQKDLSGQWKVVQVLRNGSDITPYVDSAGFRIALQDDKTYTLQGNNIPFVVNSSGTWSVDDPQYPYKLFFTPKDSVEAIIANIGTPVAKGRRGLTVTFSPGCHANEYIYSFEKIQ